MHFYLVNFHTSSSYYSILDTYFKAVFFWISKKYKIWNPFFYGFENFSENEYETEFKSNIFYTWTIAEKMDKIIKKNENHS